MTRRLLSRAALAIGVAAVLVPAVALAGKPVTSGDQKLQVKASLNPAKAGAKPVTLGVSVSYTNPKNSAQQSPYNTRQLIFTGRYATHPFAVPACKESSNIKAKGKTSGCPANTKIGSGSVVVNAAPTIKQPITGTVTVYNGVNDGGFGGHPKGARNIFLFVQTSLHINVTDVFYIEKAPGGGTKLVADMSKPTKPGITPGSFTIKHITLSVSGGTASKPYFSDATACRGSWPFSFTINNWFNQPSVTAHDKVACTK
jgi:hypothetical protein